MDNLTVIVLAAGGDTRMKSKTMKVLHPIGGRSMIGHVLHAVQAVEPTSVVAVVGTGAGPHQIAATVLPRTNQVAGGLLVR
ncbi:NTP transferase domain-containing protein [Nocardioides sp. GCM10028917]|uniref:NTP transferase domain-containing protein n=1 Tax=Nocardioides sp. GCM10028917 TaxID=3273408 RepID=UPI0036066CA2